MALAVDTWAVVLSTFVSPVAAVSITLWNESRRSLRDRRLAIFRILMATRRAGLTPEHVGALNLVEVDFYGCSKVQAKWSEYKGHLFRKAPADAEWLETRERLLANLLFEMGSVLKLNIPAMEIFKGGYAPSGWETRDAKQNEAIDYVLDLAKSKNAVPIRVMPEQSDPPTLDG